MLKALDTICLIAAFALVILMMYLATAAPADTARLIGLFTNQQLTDVNQ